MYYLFIYTKKDLQKYKAEFERVKNAIEVGKTPVQNELRTANTILFESFPYQTLSGIFLVIGTVILNKLQINELAKKYKGCRCSKYCSVWNSEDKDCEIMGENHLSPSRCRWFLMQELRKEEK